MDPGFAMTLEVEFFIYFLVSNFYLSYFKNVKWNLDLSLQHVLQYADALMGTIPERLIQLEKSVQKLFCILSISQLLDPDPNTI